MSNIDNDKKSIYVLNGYGQISIYDGNSGPFTDGGAFEVGQASVRPVVNIDKCAIDGGCEIEEIQVEDGCKEDVKNENANNNPILSVIVGSGNELNNPSTGDNIIVYMVGLGFSIVYLILSSIYLKKYNKD